jgi:hypothetical protein
MWGTSAGLALIAAGMTGCVASGPIAGRLTEPGKPPQAITLDYRSDRFGENGTMSVTLPSGEKFSGRYLQPTSETSGEVIDPMWGGFSMGFDSWGGEGGIDSASEAWVVGDDVPAFAQYYSGKVIALLLGDRGNKMRCRFRLSNPAEGMSSGGVGECQITGGGKIDAEF